MANIDSERGLQIEKAFEETLKIATQKKTSSDLSDTENILSIMKSRPEKIWWFAHEFMGFHDIKGNKFFIGYECSARLSELALNIELIESRRAGKYVVRRYRFENKQHE